MDDKAAILARSHPLWLLTHNRLFALWSQHEKEVKSVYAQRRFTVVLNNNHYQQQQQQQQGLIRED